jgi:hypothetical protein
VGRINPKDEKFFVAISEISEDEKRTACEWGHFGLADNLDGSFGNRCLANYEIEFSASFGFFNASTDTYHFGSEYSKFILYGTGHFTLFRTEARTSHISHGRCEKIN